MRSVVTVIAVVCCTCFVDGQPSCSRNGTGDCSIPMGHTCNAWTVSSAWEYEYDGSRDYLALSTPHRTREMMKSRLLCSTENDANCFIFSFFFEEDKDSDLNLSVSIATLGTGDRDEVWKKSSSELWEYALIPVRTTSDFSIILEVEGSVYKTVYIDDIDYRSVPCITTATASVQNNTKVGKGAPVESPNKVGMILGITVAVVALIVVIVVLVLFVVSKRKQSRMYASSGEENEDAGITAYDNSAVNIKPDDDDPTRARDVDISVVNTESDPHSHYDTIQPPNAYHYYSAMKPPEEPIYMEPI